MKHGIRISVLVCALMLVAVSSASAATKPFGCRASTARAMLGSATLLEPIIANRPLSPCKTDGDGVNTVSLANQGTQIADAGPAGVFTYSSDSQPTTAGPVAPAAAALASVDGVTIPTPSGSIVIVGPATASASYECKGGQVVATGRSDLDLLRVNGQDVTLTPNQNTVIQLGGGSFISANEKTQTTNSLIERVLHVHLQGLLDVVVGEAQVTENTSDPCAGTTTTPAVPIVPISACPAGSTYNPADQFCEIVGPGGTIIIISRPFQGPTGGTVLALSVARKRFRSACLNGAGPDYAIVGTSKADRIIGTRRPERILGLAGNDRIAGQGGADCIDGGSGNDRIYAGNGNSRLYGGSGNDRLWGGNGNNLADGGSGNDHIYLGNGNDRAFGGSGNDVISVGRGNDRVDGGSGNDQISTSDGNDTVLGGSGNDRISVGNGRDRIDGGPGNDRIYAPGETDAVTCGAGRDTAFVNVFASGYAGRHGCEVVRDVRPHHL